MTRKVRQAIIIMVVCILGSSTISAVSRMNKMSDAVESVFFNGDKSHNDNLSIYKDLTDSMNSKLSYATNTVSMSKYYDLDGDSHTKAIQSTLASMRTEKSISKLYKLNATLDENFNWLTAALEGKNLSEEHKRMLKAYKDGYKSHTITASYESYNSLVDEYYKETKGIPGGIFQLFVDSPEYFR